MATVITNPPHPCLTQQFKPLMEQFDLDGLGQSMFLQATEGLELSSKS